MQTPTLHPHSKKDWKLLHADQDLDRFFGRLAEWTEHYPEPVLLEM